LDIADETVCRDSLFLVMKLRFQIDPCGHHERSDPRSLKSDHLPVAAGVPKCPQMRDLLMPAGHVALDGTNYCTNRFTEDDFLPGSSAMVKVRITEHRSCIRWATLVLH
jgi:hypothetical protein